MDNLEPLKIGEEFVRLRDLKIILETWRLLLSGTFLGILPQKTCHGVQSISSLVM